MQKTLMNYFCVGAEMWLGNLDIAGMSMMKMLAIRGTMDRYLPRLTRGNRPWWKKNSRAVLDNFLVRVSELALPSEDEMNLNIPVVAAVVAS